MPQDAPRLVRLALGLAQEAPLRIAYVAGPGDVCGTYDHWRQGLHDPRTPVIAYSSMFYSVVASLGATALVLVEQDRQPTAPDPLVRFVHTPRRRGRGGLAYRLDQRRFADRVLRQLDTFKADVILVGTDAPMGLIRRLPKARRIILTAHNTFWPMGRLPQGLRGRLRRWAIARALKRVDVALNTSGECARQVAALGGPSGTQSLTETPQIPASLFPAVIAGRTLPRRLLFLGRIEANKGIFDLLESFKHLAAQVPDLTLGFAGSGSAEDDLRAAIAASGCADRITLHGMLSSAEVHRLLDQTDLLVCPTRSSFAEGLALVVIEAAAHGVPSVLSSVVPAKELLPGGCLEFPADDAAALTDSLRRIVTEAETYARLRDKVLAQRGQFMDRGASWGSQLYRALALHL